MRAYLSLILFILVASAQSLAQHVDTPDAAAAPTKAVPASAGTVAAPIETGSVTGHVICGDTNRPARMASVVLQPVVDPDLPAEHSETGIQTESSNNRNKAMTKVAITLLDGSFTIPNVKPGEYYVLAEKPGYLSPRTVFTREQLNHPDALTKDRIAELLTKVTVVANTTATAEATLVKGASIAGTVRFDDGAPNANASVYLMRKDTDGRWVPFQPTLLANNFNDNMSNDRGQFRLVGLPAGEYLLKTQVRIAEVEIENVMGPYGGGSTGGGYSLDVCFGDVFRQRDAKTIKVKEAEQSEGNDIEIPASKLHSVSGTLVDSASGKPVNSGWLLLRYANDNEALTQTKVTSDDGAFHFLFVPESEYTLEVSAQEVKREEVPACPHCWPATQTKETPVQEYEQASQTIVVHGETSGVSVALKPTATDANHQEPE